MGLSKMTMLDRSMLSFVEPLGPRQIIDRQSIVELPPGFIKVKFLKKPNRYDLEILDYKTDINSHENLNMQLSAKSYLAIGDMLIEGRGAGEKPIYEFEVEQSEYRNKRKMDNTTILQICIYVLPSAYKNKVFTGLVHVAIDELFNKSITENNAEIQAWYKIFSRSAFIAGCPIADVTPHCVSDNHPSIDTITKSKTCPNIKISAKKGAENANKPLKSTKSKLFVTRANNIRMTQSFLKLVQRRKSEIPPSRIPVVGVDFGVSSLSTSSVDVGYGTSSSSSGPSAVLPTKSVNSRRPTLPGKIFRRFSMITTQNFREKSRRNSSWGGSSKSPLRQFQRTEEVYASPLPWTETQESTASVKSNDMTFSAINFSPKSSTSENNSPDKDFFKYKSVKISDYKSNLPIRSNSVSVTKSARIISAFHQKSNSVQGKESKSTLKFLGRSTNLKFNKTPSPGDDVFDDGDDNVYDVLLSLKSLPTTIENRSTSSTGSEVSINDGVGSSEIKSKPADVNPKSSQISVDKNKNFKVSATVKPQNVNLSSNSTNKGGNQNRNNNTEVRKQADKRLYYAWSHKRSTLLNTKNSSIESSASSSDHGNMSSFELDNISVTDNIFESSLTKNESMKMIAVKHILLPPAQHESDDEYLTCDE